MKLKSLHIRSPKDDEDISCLITSNGNEKESNQSVGLILNPYNERVRTENQATLTDEILNATTELGSLLSNLQSHEPQVLILSSPTRNNSGQSAFNYQEQILQGNIVLFNQNTKAKTAEKQILNNFTQKYFSCWFQTYKSHRWHRLRIKKNIMKEWKKIMNDLEIHSDSTETLVDSMREDPYHNHHQNKSKPAGKQPEHSSRLFGMNPKVLTVDILSEEMSSISSNFFQRQQTHKMGQVSSSELKEQTIIKSVAVSKTTATKTPSKATSKIKSYQLPTKSDHSLSRINSSSYDERSQLSSLSQQNKQQPAPELTLKYPNLHLINNYVKLYEQEEAHEKEQQQKNHLTKPKKLFKSVHKSPAKTTGTSKSSSKENEKPNSQKSPHRNAKEHSKNHFTPLLNSLTEEQNENDSVVSSLSAASNTKRGLNGSATKKGLSIDSKLERLSSKQRLARVNQQIKQEKVPHSSLHHHQEDLLVGELSPIPQDIHSFHLHTVDGPISPILTHPTSTNSLSSMLMKIRNKHSQQPQQQALDSQRTQGKDSDSLCNIDSASFQNNRSNNIDLQQSDDTTSSSQVPVAFGKKLKEKLQKYQNVNKPIPTETIQLQLQQQEILQRIDHQPIMSSDKSLPQKKPVITTNQARRPSQVSQDNDSDVSSVFQSLKPGDGTNRRQSLSKNTNNEEMNFHNLREIPSSSFNPLQNRLTMIKQKISEERQQPTENRSQHQTHRLEVEEAENVLLTRKTKTLLRKSFQQLRSIVKKGFYYHELQEQSLLFHQMKLKRKFFHYLFRLSNQLSFHRSDHHYRSKQHIWGNDSFALQYHLMKWKTFFQERKDWARHEQLKLTHLQQNHLRKSFATWKFFSKDRWTMNNQIQEKILKKSPKAGLLYSPQSKGISFFTSPSMIKSDEKENNNINEQKGSSVMKSSPSFIFSPVSVPPATVPSTEMTIRRRLSSIKLSLEETWKNEAKEASEDSHDERVETKNTSFVKKEELQVIMKATKEETVFFPAEDDQSSVFQFEEEINENDSIYISVSSISYEEKEELDHYRERKEKGEERKFKQQNQNHFTQVQSTVIEIRSITTEKALLKEGKEEITLKKKRENKTIPIFVKKRMVSFLHYYQSYSYYQYCLKLKILQRFLNHSLQKKWNREMKLLVVDHYRKKLKGKVLQYWKEFHQQKQFLEEVYETYDSDYNSYDSYDSQKMSRHFV
jgi:hypothetical protein